MNFIQEVLCVLKVLWTGSSTGRAMGLQSPGLQVQILSGPQNFHIAEQCSAPE